jgi:hypothetical protein
MSDIEFMLKVKGELGYMPRVVAVEVIANRYDLTRSGVSGMVSRAEKTLKGQVALMAYLTDTTPTVSPSQSKIDSVIKRGKEAFKFHKSGLGRKHYAVFLSDLHIPEQHNRALHLAYKIIDDLPNVAYISTLNDGLDFARLSFWDRRGLKGNALEDDIANSLNIHSAHMAILHSIAPNALFPAVIGNHDLRIAAHGTDAGIGDYNAAGLMERLAGEGVNFNSSIARYNMVTLSEGLVWGHGVYSSINRVSAARKNYAYYKRVADPPHNRSDFDFIFGHTHGQAVLSNGIHRIINAGCLCNLQPHYMRHTPDWRLGFVISEFDPCGHEVDSRIIEIQGTTKLTARNPFNGKVYYE